MPPIPQLASPDRAAVVLVEFQKQWTDPGLYNLLIRSQLRSKNALENTRRLVREARDAGANIIHAPLVIDPKNKRGWLAHLTFGQVFTKGTPRAEFADGLYQEGDAVARGRYDLDPFVGSDLEALLCKSGAETVFFGGFLSDQCAGKGALTALREGFDAYLLSDCTATVTGLQEKWIERRLEGRVVSSHEVSEKLRHTDKDAV